MSIQMHQADTSSNPVTDWTSSTFAQVTAQNNQPRIYQFERSSASDLTTLLAGIEASLLRRDGGIERSGDDKLSALAR
jgi:hypothetical protein